MSQEQIIPPLPSVTSKVIQYKYDSPDASITDIEEIIRPDQGITSEILRVANSAYYGRSGRIKNLKDAITLLGLKALKNLVVFINIKNISGPLKGDMFRKYLKEMPVLSALVAQDISNLLKKKELVDDVFLTALLAKVGMTLLALQKGSHYSLLMEQSDKNNFNLKELERKSYGVDHNDLTREVAEKWNLPDVIKSSMGMDSTDPKDMKSDIQKITLLSTLIAEHLSGAKGGKDPIMLSTNIIDSHFNGMISIDKFTTESYVTHLRKHPYYELAVV